MEDPAPTAPTVYASPEEAERLEDTLTRRQPAQRGARQNANSGLKAQLAVIQERVESQEEVIRRLGVAFASLSTLQDHGAARGGGHGGGLHGGQYGHAGHNGPNGPNGHSCPNSHGGQSERGFARHIERGYGGGFHTGHNERQHSNGGFGGRGRRGAGRGGRSVSLAHQDYDE